MQKIFDPKVFQLGYVALDTPDLSRAEEHYLEAIGLTLTDKGDDGEIYLSVGFEHHNVVLRPGTERAIGNIGFQLKPGIELGSFVKNASNYGLRAQIKSDSQPGVAALAEIELPGGLSLQFYTDIASPAPGFKGIGVSPLRLGHVAIMNTEGLKLMKFFEDFLGFWYTDTFGGFFNFYTCNRDHHVVNVVNGTENRYHHLAFQLKCNASHPMAADTLRRRGVKQEWGPARHPAGHNFAGYHRDPDGVMVELYTEMDVFIPELNMCEPRPWHEHFPMHPRDWGGSDLNAWGAEFISKLE
mgnify:CR=1 FL=1